MKKEKFWYFSFLFFLFIFYLHYFPAYEAGELPTMTRAIHYPYTVKLGIYPRSQFFWSINFMSLAAITYSQGFNNFFFRNNSIIIE